MPDPRACVLLVGITLLGASAGAQAPPPAGPPTPAFERGCRGDQMLNTMIIQGAAAHEAFYPTITAVPPGTPAERAGLQVGDTVVTVNGVDLLTGSLPPRRFAVGDTLRMLVRRGGTAYPIALVMGRIVASSADPGSPRVCRPANSLPASVPARAPVAAK